MKTKTAILSVVITTFPGLLHGQSPITFEEVNNKFGIHSKANNLRKNHDWQTYKGKCVTWIGELVDVSDRFSAINGITLRFKHLDTTFSNDVSVAAPVSMKRDFMDLQIGEMYKYMATLENYGGAILPIQATWGCDPNTDVNTNVEYHGIIKDQKPVPSDRSRAVKAAPQTRRSDLKPETIEASWKVYRAEQEAEKLAHQKRKEEAARRKKEHVAFVCKDLKAGGRTLPVALAKPGPMYTEEAINARVQGTILLQCVIRKDGRVDNCKVVRGLGYGLDEKNLWLVETYWRFRPATLHRQPVDDFGTFELQFNLR